VATRLGKAVAQEFGVGSDEIGHAYKLLSTVSKINQSNE
jgi:hypothetical protein